MSYTRATERTIYFIGATTGQSSIMKVFPRWAEALTLNAVIKGIDFALNDDAARYREAVRFIKEDPLSLGALVTTHKVNVFKASRDLFDELDSNAETLGEISSISKRGGRLCGHAKDPITVGRALEAIVDEGYSAPHGRRASDPWGRRRVDGADALPSHQGQGGPRRSHSRRRDSARRRTDLPTYARSTVASASLFRSTTR